MKHFLIAVMAALAMAGVATAQEAQLPPSDELAAQFYTETGQLRIALGQAQAKTIAQRRQIVDLEARLKAAEEKAKAASTQPEK